MARFAMASKYRSLFDADVQDALSNVPVAPDQPQIDLAKAQTLARSTNDPAASRAGNAMLDDIDRQKQRDARKAEFEAKKQTREQEKQAKEQAAQAEAERARSVRAGAASGQKTVTDIETGKRTIAQHPDGAPVFKPGPIGAPQEVATATSMVMDQSTGKEQAAPASNPLVPGDGVLGATGGESKAVIKQPVRDDRGNVSLVTPQSTTDPKSGVQYVTRTDETTGLPTKQAVGVDEATQEKIRKDTELEQRRQELALRDNAVKQSRVQFNPKWEPVKKEFDAVAKDHNDFNNPDKQPFMRAAVPGTRDTQGWYERDPKTSQPRVDSYGQPVRANPAELVKWQADQKDLQTRYDTAKAAHDRMAPFAENLNRNEREITDARLKLTEEKIRHDAGLPEEDGGISRIIASLSTDTFTTDQAAADQVAQALESVPQTADSGANPPQTLDSTGSAVRTDTPQSTGEKSTSVPETPLPDTPETRDAFQSISGLAGVTATKEGSFTSLNRNGRWIASLETQDGYPALTLKDVAADDAEVMQIVRQTNGGIPVYLRDNKDRPKAVVAADQVAQFIGMANQAGMVTPETVKKFGMDPVSVRQKVADGLMSVQVGEAVMKSFGQTLKVDDYQDPANFEKWLKESSAKQTADLNATYGRTDLKAQNTPEQRLESAKSMTGRSRSEALQVKLDYIRDFALKNFGKPGLSRGELLKAYASQDPGISKLDPLNAGHSLVTLARDSVLGSMLGLAAGATVDLGAAEMALFGSEEAAKMLKEDMQLRNRDLANWMNAAGRNAKAWATPDGRATMNAFESAVGNLRNTVDQEVGQTTPDRARIDAAEMKVREAALALHNLNPDESWPMTLDSLDPNKDSSLGSALADYSATADPRSFELYKERLLMNNGRRQYSADLQRKLESIGATGNSFFQAVGSGAYSGWQEAASELVADAAMLASAGASKALQAGLKATGATGKATKVARLSAAMGRGLESIDKLGIVEGTLQKPLTVMQKARNFAAGGIKGAIGEGGEELIVEPGADAPQLADAFLGGFIAPLSIIPAQIAAQQIRQAATGPLPEKVEAQRSQKWASQFNAAMEGTPGFTPVTPDQAKVAANFVDPKTYLQATRTIAQEMDRLQSVEGDSEQSTALRDQMRAGLSELSGNLAIQTTQAISAAQAVDAIDDPQQKAFFSGIAKVATGNTDILTQAERASVGGRTTREGSPYFAQVAQPDGSMREVLTDEARAEVMSDMPAIGALISTTESQAILEARAATTQPQPTAPNERYPQGTPGPQASAQAPQPAPANAIAPGGPVSGGAGGNEQPAAAPANGAGFTPPAAQAQVGPNLAAMDAGEYAAYQQTEPTAQPLASVVQDAFDAGRPVSASMAANAGIVLPEGYARQGAMFVPPPAAATTEAPAAQSPESPTMAKARAAVERVASRFPKLPSIFDVETTEGPIRTGGAYAHDGGITINLPDLERDLSGYTPETQDARIDAILDEEIIHFAQFEAVRRMGEDVQAFYADLWNDFTPEQKSAAAATYQASFADKSPWEQAAETVRMLIQERADGRVTELTKAFSIRMPERLVKLLKEAVKVLKSIVESGSISTRIQDAIVGIETILNEYAATNESRGSSQQDVAESAKRPQAESEPTTLQTTGQAISAALERYPMINGDRKLKNSLYDLTGDLAEVMDGMPAAERRAFLDQAFQDWADELDLEGKAKASEALGKRNAERAARIQQAKEAARSRLRDKARAILNSDAYSALSSIFAKGTITPKPHAIPLILARKRSGAKLTEKELGMLRNLSEWDGVPRKQDYPGGGNNVIIREIIDMIIAAPGEGQMPNVMADKLTRGVTTASEMFEKLASEFRAIANGQSVSDSKDDPNRDWTDEEIAAELEKPQPEPQGPSTLSDARSEAADAFAETSDIVRKIDVIDEFSDRFNDEEFPHVLAAVFSEIDRIHADVVSAASYQARVQPFSKSSAAFQRFLDSHTPESLREKLEALPEPQAPVLFSSPSSSGRTATVDVPDAVIAYDLGSGTNHPDYAAAKSGDRASAIRLARDMVRKPMIDAVRNLIGDSKPVIVPVLAIEATGHNKIPLAIASRLGELLDLQRTTDIVQMDKANRGSKSALDRVFATVTFDGPVKPGESYLLIDDTLTQGGTFAALAEHITSRGGKVVGAVALTGKQYSATLRLSEGLLNQLRSRLGDVEQDFRRATGHGYEFLTESEARTLVKFKPIDAVRSRILEEGNARGRSMDGLNAGQTDSPLGSSPTPSDNLFPSLPQGPLAKFKENAGKAYDAAANDTARANIAKQVQAREGVKKSGSFVGQAQRSLDFGTSGSFETRNQTGFTFDPTTPSGAVAKAAAETDPAPTEAQIEAGNYRKGKVTLHGMPISIENPQGSIRRGTDEDGKAWETEMKHHYGYFLGTLGRDKDHVDVFVGPNPESSKAFVVNQINPKNGSFDEHKVMIGFDTRKDAIAGYLANYQPGWKGLGNVVAADVVSLKAWLDAGKVARPAKESDFTASPMDTRNTNSRELFQNDGGFQLTGEKTMDGGKEAAARKATEDAKAKQDREQGRIADFGEKIGGAKKDLWSGFRDSMKNDLPENMADFTMAKNFPEPNWEKLIESGVSESNVAALKAIRDMVPRKPGSNYKIRRWAELVRALHIVAQGIVSGRLDMTSEAAATSLKKHPIVGRQVTLYQALGMPAILNAKGWMLKEGSFHQFGDIKSENGSVNVMYVEHDGRGFYREAGAKGLSSNPETLPGIIEFVRARIEEQSAKEPVKKQTEFNVWRDTRSGDHFIGKRMPGRPAIRLKAGFENAQDALDYLKEHRAELEAMWTEMRKDPVMRNETNMPRVGPSRRDGDVTPEQFQAAFGFRGVEFGNWVAGGERQGSMNEAFDALTDLAEILGVPTQALSLDGSLGLAFGARGGGRFAAHYEPGKVVINLTKTKGAGALAHEWFHGLDNYFARLDKTGKSDPVSLDRMATKAAGDSPQNVRAEVWEAFRKIKTAIDQSTFSKRSSALDATRQKPYYGTIVEMAARAFEQYVVDRLDQKAAINDYLANIARSSEAFPTKDEMNLGIREAYDNLFQTLETQTTDKGVRLQSSPSPSPEESAAVQAALAAMNPRMVAIYQAADAGRKNADIMAEFGVTERGIANAIDQVRARIQVAIRSASKDGLNPDMKDGLIDGGRPDLAFGANPTMAATDQIRNESGVPDVRGREEVTARAEEMLAQDYQGTYDSILNAARENRQLADHEVAAAKIILGREMLRGASASKAERVKLGMLAYGYREIGTETARALAMRFDPHLKPAERHAQFLAEALTTPDTETRNRMRKNPKQAESILGSWLDRTGAIKAELLAQGIDIDASLSEFNRQNEARLKAEAESPRMKAALDTTIRKLSPIEKSVVETIRSGALVSAVQNTTGLPVSEIKEIWQNFVGDFETNVRESVKRFMANSLGSSPANLMAQLKAEFGIFDWDVIDDTKKDFVDRREEIKNPRPPRAKKPKAAEPPQIPELSPEKQAELDAAFERFQNADPATWSTFWQTEAKNLVPMVGQVAFEEFKGKAQEAWTAVQQDLFQDPKLPINETRGTFDIHDPLSVKQVIDAFAIARGSKMDALIEYWRASILTGPQTHIVNTTSNLLNLGYHLLPQRGLEATWNALLGLVGQNADKGATFGEFAPMARNLHKAMQLAARNMLRSWKLETRVFDHYAAAEALQLDFTGVGAEYIPPALGGRIGKIMRSLSFRAMTAADEFMKSLYGQLEAAAQAHRIAAVEEKLTGDAYAKRIDTLMQPGSQAWIRAIDGARLVTFQGELDGENPQSIRRLDQLADLAKKGRSMPWIGRPLTFVLPFIDTPLNIFKQAVEMSPLGTTLSVIDGARALKRRVLSGKLTKEEARAEAALLYDRARLVRDLSNQTVGWAVIFAMQGLVQGGDDDDPEKLPVITGTVPYKTTRRGERDNAYAVMPPQTIRIGGVQFSYSRFEPFATMLASAADLMNEMHRNGGMKPAVFSEWIMRFKDSAKDKTFLQGVSNLLNAVEDPDRFAERMAGDTISGFVPNIVRQPVRESDKTIRDQNPRADDGFFTAIAKRVGFSIVPQAAPAKYDVWGNPVPSNRGDLVGGTRATDMAFRILDPTNAQLNPRATSLDRWIFRYNKETADSKQRVSIEPIPNSLQGKLPNEARPRVFALTPAEQDEANRNAGKAALEAIGADGWKDAPLTWDNAQRIMETVRRSQEIERARIRMQKLASVMETP